MPVRDVLLATACWSAAVRSVLLSPRVGIRRRVLVPLRTVLVRASPYRVVFLHVGVFGLRPANPAASSLRSCSVEFAVSVSRRKAARWCSGFCYNRGNYSVAVPGATR